MSPRVCGGIPCLLATLALVAACGGSDVVTGPDGESTPGPNDPPVSNPSFAQDVNPIFSATGCTAGHCHGGGAGGLTLTSSASTNHANLVGVASSCGSFLLVSAGNADDSYLVMKLENRNTCSGARMPLGGPALSANQIGTIRNWIEAGAPNN